MPTKVETIDLKTTTREETIDITSLVRSMVKKAGVDSGVAWIYCPHTTAGITIQENSDPDVKKDLVNHMRKLVPKDAGFVHSEDNSDSHIKGSLMGASEGVPIEGGKLLLGTWQAIFFCEFDGPRVRKVLVKVLEG